MEQIRKARMVNANVQEPQKTVFSLKYVIICAVFIIVGLVLLIVSLRLQPSQSSGDLWALFLNQLATAVIVSGVLSGAFELFLRKDFLDMSQKSTNKIIDNSFFNTELILSEITLVERERSLGLTEVLINATGYNYESLILGSTTLTIILNDGERWSKNNELLLERRFEDPSKSTVFILLHPDSPEVLALARKVESDQASIRKKISETIDFLNKRKRFQTKLDILGHDFPNPYSLFIGDEEAYITLYFHAGDTRQFPLFRFKNMIDTHCYFKSLQRSTEKLKSVAKDISYYDREHYRKNLEKN